MLFWLLPRNTYHPSISHITLTLRPLTLKLMTGDRYGADCIPHQLVAEEIRLLIRVANNNELSNSNLLEYCYRPESNTTKGIYKLQVGNMCYCSLYNGHWKYTVQCISWIMRSYIMLIFIDFNMPIYLYHKVLILLLIYINMLNIMYQVWYIMFKILI